MPASPAARVAPRPRAHPPRSARRAWRLAPATVVVLAVAVAATPWRAHAQCCRPTSPDLAHAVEAARVAGRIVVAGRGAPVRAARVALYPVDDAPGAPRLPLRATSDSLGEYGFAMVPRGRWVLQVRALGYRPARVELDLAAEAAPRLSVGLRLEAIALHPVRIQEAAGAARREGTAAAAPGRRDLEAARLARLLPGDARLVAAADLREAVPLGETDLFRGMQRLPGVTTRDDLSAELWVRGGGWGQTLVRFDGVPLFAPLHAAGVFSALPERAVGELSFHPGVQPLGAGGATAALVLVDSRRALADGRLHGDATLSPVSAQLALSRGSADGVTGWTVAGRRSTLDRGLGRTVARALPYRFGELVVRADRALGGDARLEGSALLTHDALDGPIARWVDSSDATMRAGVVRLTVDQPLAGGRVRHAAGVSWLGARLGSGDRPRYAVGLQPGDGDGVLRLWDADNRIALAFVESVWRRTGEDDAPATTLGARIERLGAHATGQGFGARVGGDALAPSTIAGSALVGVLWGERRWSLGALTLEGGARVEGGSVVRGAPALRVAPRIAARHRVGASTYLTAAAARTHQYAQPFTPRSERLHALATVGTHWLVAGREQPVARGDVATLGAERWIGPTIVLAATGYARAAEGIVIPDPRPGTPVERPAVQVGSQRARGVELSLRRPEGRLTGGLSYARGGAALTADGERTAAPWERQTVLHATTALAVHTRLTVGGAYTDAAGAPFTRAFPATVQCESPTRCVWTRTAARDAASALRLPRYASLDAHASYTARRAAPQVVAVGSIRNLRRVATPGAYVSTAVACIQGAASGNCDRLPFGEGLWREDQRLRGAARLASAELRVAW